MILKSVRLVVASVMFAALLPAASAQQGSVPSGTTLPKPAQGQGKPPSVTPNMVVKPSPVTKPVTGLIPAKPAVSWDQYQANARDHSSMLTCQAPLTLEIRAVDARDASKGVYFLLSFNEAATATSVRPGECWRDAGFQLGDGNLNRGLKKGDLYYDPQVVKCPAIKTMKIEGGKISGTFNDNIYSEKMFDAASGPGQFAFETKWLNFNGPTGQANGWGHYVAVFGDALTPSVPGCRG